MTTDAAHAISIFSGPLASVTISGRACLVDESLLPGLAAMAGQRVILGHVAGRWSLRRASA